MKGIVQFHSLNMTEVFRALLRELRDTCTELQEDGVLSFASEDPKFRLSVYLSEGGNVRKFYFENKSESDTEKLEAVIAALSDLLIEGAKADPAQTEDNVPTPKGEGEKSEENKDEAPGEGKEEKKEDGGKNDEV